MKKVMLIAISMSLGACATTYERCTEVVSNPYDLEANNPETIVAAAEIVHEAHPSWSKQQVVDYVTSTFKVEWMSYGSIDQCLARKDASDQAILNNMVAGFNAGRGAYKDETESLRRQSEEMSKKPPEVNVFIQK